jgi:hypothetical protein
MNRGQMKLTVGGFVGSHALPKFVLVFGSPVT